jgi:hypothetical protein
MVKLGKTKNVVPMKLAKTIMDRFHASVATLAHDYCKLRNTLKQLVIHPNPGILARRDIVFSLQQKFKSLECNLCFKCGFLQVGT